MLYDFLKNYHQDSCDELFVRYGYAQLLRDDPKIFAQSMVDNLRKIGMMGFFGDYYFQYNYDWNEGIAFNYFLLQEGPFFEAFVNDFKYVDGYVYYTVVDGAWPEPDCYFDSNLKLKRINLNNNQIEVVDPAKYQKIYQQLDKLSWRDIKWLDNPNNRCSVKFPEKWG